MAVPCDTPVSNRDLSHNCQETVKLQYDARPCCVAPGLSIVLESDPCIDWIEGPADIAVARVFLMGIATPVGAMNACSIGTHTPRHEKGGTIILHI